MTLRDVERTHARIRELTEEISASSACMYRAKFPGEKVCLPAGMSPTERFLCALSTSLEARDILYIALRTQTESLWELLRTYKSYRPEREFIKLYYLCGMTRDEVVAALGIDKSTFYRLRKRIEQRADSRR
ncbi:hypothetical protein FACS18949_14390 [Clostridia bacterium]|nr:hypothetical protein FACS189425_07200 [Clostridia bacterium]GHV35769.1 hypothetical protein FACS18949_14390 [Clostridia bacterium]